MPRKELMARLERRRLKRTLLRAEGVRTPDWKDTGLLRKFISDRGKIRARRVTGLTKAEQRAVAKAVENAREMALLPYPGNLRQGASDGSSPSLAPRSRKGRSIRRL
jgi:small subunit ribosomal protein S18